MNTQAINTKFPSNLPCPCRNGIKYKNVDVITRPIYADDSFINN